MCGIAGFMATVPRAVERGSVENAIRRLTHRGPDDFGFVSFARGETYLGRDFDRHPDGAWLSLIQRRLSILDLSEAGWQPMTDDSGRYFLVFNGEIYNYVELREELIALGYQFRSGTDTEVLLKAFIEWGTAALPRLVGMFSFALYDSAKNRLLLARDFFGIKPLYYRVDEGGLGFASEIKVLLDEAPKCRQPNPARLYQYLCFGLTDHGQETLFDGISQVPAAHYLDVDLARPREAKLQRYWRLELGKPLDISFEEATAEVRRLFLDSVRLHMRSDVPIGAALSGGIDSSAIVMAMRHLGGSRLDLHAFSYIADDPALSEEKWIDMIGEAAGANVHKVRAGAAEMADDLKRVTQVQDEPFGSTSICVQNRVFGLAHAHGIKVMLDGQGADELLAGYRPFQSARLATLLRRGQLRSAARFWNQASALPGSSRWGMGMRAGAQVLPGPLRRLTRRHLAGDTRPQWLNADWFAARGIGPQTASELAGSDVLRSTLRRAVEEVSLPGLLRYEDRNSMAYSIESRVPFLTPQFGQFVLSLPERYIISDDGISKYVFREAMRGIVPDPILDRRDKIGFATPEQRWLTALKPWIEQLLADERAAHVHPLRLDVAGHEWGLIAAGQKPFGAFTWRWMNVIEWTQQYEIRYAA